MRNEEQIREYFKTFLSQGKTHKNYTRTVELAELYHKLFTGMGIDTLLRRIVTRETDEMFEQRKTITKHIIPSVLNSLKMPFYKVCRTQPLVKKVDWEDGDVEQKLLSLDKGMVEYWGGRDVTEFMEWALVDYSMIDPNAFVITDFEEFDAKIEKAKPYPIIIPSKDVVDYKYVNNNLSYLSIVKAVKYTEDDKEMEGKQYTILEGDITYQFTQVGKRDEHDIIIDKYFFRFNTYYPKAAIVPAYRIGFIPDLITEGDTMLSIYHSAIPLLEKTLKINSEMDLSASMVAFPQRFAYAQACNNQGCHRGTLADGGVCPVCDGTGLAQRHGSTADVIELPMPNNPEDMIDLSRLLHYVMPPIELLRFQDEYIDKMRAWVYSTVFNSDVFTRSEISETATAKLLESDNMNDTLYPFARSYSNKWELTIQLIATFTDLGNGIIIDHKLPHNFGFKSLNELMQDLSTAISSGASSGTIAAIEDDINERLYVDRPDELNKIRIKNLFNPFRGFDSQRIALSIGTGRTTKYNEVLYLNLESIFQELERETASWLYDMPISVIKKLIDDKVKAIIDTIENENPTPRLPFREV